jgi:hypothetical protein
MVRLVIILVCRNIQRLAHLAILARRRLLADPFLLFNPFSLIDSIISLRVTTWRCPAIAPKFAATHNVTKGFHRTGLSTSDLDLIRDIGVAHQCPFREVTLNDKANFADLGNREQAIGSFRNAENPLVK